MNQLDQQNAYDELHYPGHEPRTLKNKYHETSDVVLSLLEADAANKRALGALPPEAKALTPDGLRAIHKHLFQDVYAWAGQNRPYTSQRNETPFVNPDVIDDKLARTFDHLRAHDGFRGLSKAAFAAAAADTIGDINAAHPFVEGNGRTQRLFLQNLAAGAGFKIEITPGETRAWNEAAKVAFDEYDNGPMAALIEKRLAPLVLVQELTMTEPPLVPRRTIPDLTETEIGNALAASPKVAGHRAEAHRLSQIVYGHASAIDATLAQIEADPASRTAGDTAARQVMSNATGIASLAGTVGKQRADSTRIAAIAAVPALARTLEMFGHAVAQERLDLINDHRATQRRATVEIAKPSPALASTLAASRAEQTSALIGSKPLRDELAALTRATAARLTPADRRAIAGNDTATLAATMGISTANAGALATTVTQITKANTLVLNETRKIQMTQALAR